jgi:hypothetical protein
MIVLEHELYKIYYNEADVNDLRDRCYLFVCAATFGYASLSKFTFTITYDHNYANWNFERPELAQYYSTPRSVFSTFPKYAGEIDPAPLIACGHIEENYYKLPWDYLAPQIKKGVKYVHPGENRVCTNLELELLYGCALGEVPDNIRVYLQKHANYYLSKAWGTQLFDCKYDKFMDRWRVNRNFDGSPFMRDFDFIQYTPRLCHPLSDRYPILPPKKF